MRLLALLLSLMAPPLLASTTICIGEPAETDDREHAIKLRFVHVEDSSSTAVWSGDARVMAWLKEYWSPLGIRPYLVSTEAIERRVEALLLLGRAEEDGMLKIRVGDDDREVGVMKGWSARRVAEAVAEELTESEEVRLGRYGTSGASEIALVSLGTEVMVTQEAWKGLHVQTFGRAKGGLSMIEAILLAMRYQDSQPETIDFYWVPSKLGSQPGVALPARLADFNGGLFNQVFVNAAFTCCSDVMHKRLGSHEIGHLLLNLGRQGHCQSCADNLMCARGSTFTSRQFEHMLDQGSATGLLVAQEGLVFPDFKDSCPGDHQETCNPNRVAYLGRPTNYSATTYVDLGGPAAARGVVELSLDLFVSCLGASGTHCAQLSVPVRAWPVYEEVIDDATATVFPARGFHSRWDDSWDDAPIGFDERLAIERYLELGVIERDLMSATKTPEEISLLELKLTAPDFEVASRSADLLVQDQPEILLKYLALEPSWWSGGYEEYVERGFLLSLPLERIKACSASLFGADQQNPGVSRAVSWGELARSLCDEARHRKFQERLSFVEPWLRLRESDTFTLMEGDVWLGRVNPVTYWARCAWNQLLDEDHQAVEEFVKSLPMSFGDHETHERHQSNLLQIWPFDCSPLALGG